MVKLNCLTSSAFSAIDSIGFKPRPREYKPCVLIISFNCLYKVAAVDKG